MTVSVFQISSSSGNRIGGSEANMNSLERIAFILVCFVSAYLALGCEKQNVLDSNRKALYMEVVNRIENGRIAIGENGIADLPPSLVHASVGGRVYARRDVPGNTMVSFNTWIGKGRNMEGYLYAKKPLSSEEIINNYWGDPELKAVEVGPVPLVIERQIDDHWYYVSHRLD